VKSETALLNRDGIIGSKICDMRVWTGCVYLSMGTDALRSEHRNELSGSVKGEVCS
jgi:hypothetical protein